MTSAWGHQAPAQYAESMRKEIKMHSAQLNLHDHADIPNEAVLPYRILRNLGHGASAVVELIEHTTTKELYARKTYKNVHTRNIREVKRRFSNEIQIIKKLSHWHFVRLQSSYTCGRVLGIILEPVADGGDLSAFLLDIRDANRPPTERQLRILAHAFGCLANGLSFMHSQTIRHKDIKPQNILIHQDSVLYTDFGISLDSSLLSHSTTTGAPAAFTRRFCAPEVADWDRRNTSSDVFSLGCVFLEILTTLDDSLLPEDILDRCYHESIEDILPKLHSFNGPETESSSMFRYLLWSWLDDARAENLVQMQKTLSHFDLDKFVWIKLICGQMIVRRPEARIAASRVAELMFLLGGGLDSAYNPYFCETCIDSLAPTRLIHSSCQKPSSDGLAGTRPAVELQRNAIFTSSLSLGGSDEGMAGPRSSSTTPAELQAPIIQELLLAPSRGNRLHNGIFSEESDMLPGPLNVKELPEASTRPTRYSYFLEGRDLSICGTVGYMEPSYGRISHEKAGPKPPRAEPNGWRADHFPLGNALSYDESLIWDDFKRSLSAIRTFKVRIIDRAVVLWEPHTAIIVGVSSVASATKQWIKLVVTDIAAWHCLLVDLDGTIFAFCALLQQAEAWDGFTKPEVEVERMLRTQYAVFFPQMIHGAVRNLPSPVLLQEALEFAKNCGSPNEAIGKKILD